MKVAIVTTTVYKDSAVYDFSALCQKNGWDFIVIGDEKTSEIKLNYGEFYSLLDQMKLPYECIKLLPLNNVSRRNIGYLIAWHKGADYIATVDDDNYPLENWIEMVDSFKEPIENIICGKNTFVNYLKYFNLTEKIIWPRGLPFNAVKNGEIMELKLDSKNIGVVAGLWNGCPDFDVIGHSLFDNINWDFRKGLRLFKVPHCLAPYNTQNTVFPRELLPFQFLPFNVGRADDIWSSYISQFVMRRKGLGTLYISPTVYQKRNEHNLLFDLHKEIGVYLYTEELVSRLFKVLPSESDISYYLDLCKVTDGLIPGDFEGVAKIWLRDLKIL